MAVSFSNTTRTVFGDKRVVLGTVTFDSSYPTGGEAVSASTFGLVSIDAVVVLGTRGVVTWSPWYNPATGKLVAQVTADGTQVANTTDLSTLVADVLVIGKG